MLGLGSRWSSFTSEKPTHYIPVLRRVKYRWKQEDMRSLAELKARAGLDSVQQFGSESPLISKLRQLQQVHAGAGSRQAVRLLARMVNAERWVQVLWRANMIQSLSIKSQWRCQQVYMGMCRSQYTEAVNPSIHKPWVRLLAITAWIRKCGWDYSL